MKHLIFIFSLAALAACSREYLLSDIVPSNKITFVVSLLPPQSTTSGTRGIVEESPDDNDVDEVTILLFSATSPHLYVDYFYVPSSEITDVSGDNTRKKFTVTILPGNYKAILIANSSNYISTQYDLTGGTVAGGGTLLTTLNITQMQNALTFSQASRWNANPLDVDYRPFPMSSQVVDLNVPNTVDFTAHPINMVRALAKVNLKVHASISSSFQISDIILCNYHESGYIVPATDWGAMGTTLFSATAVHPYGIATSGVTGFSYSDVIDANGCVDEIFTNEQAAPVNEANFDGVGGWKTESLCLLVKASGQTAEGVNFTDHWYRLDFLKVDTDDNDLLKHVPILRNYKYTLEVMGVGNTGYDTDLEAYNHPPDGLQIDLTAANDIEELNDITYNGLYQLAVDRSFVVVKGSGAGVLKVYTDYSEGWQVATITSVGNWLTSGNFSPDGTTTANGSAASVVTISAPVNPTGAVRKATVTLTAGNLRKTIEVWQFPMIGNIVDNLTGIEKPYVGAFWKANQTGERLIRMVRNSSAADGAWMAAVVEGDNWIVLDTVMTTDPNVGWRTDGSPVEANVHNGNDITFDVQHGLNSSATVINGTMSATTGMIYFRIGLKSTYLPTSTAPARYGMVVVAANNGAMLQRIWIRQGEASDYVMRPTDGVNSGGMNSLERIDAAKFSPYNLTAEVLNQSVLTQADVLLGMAGNHSRLTDYPTQTGALFQWASSNNVRFAYEPHTVSTPAGWNTSFPVAYWSTLYATHESCPPNYRRVNDGVTSTAATGVVNDSEMRQSLYTQPLSGSSVSSTENSVYGYYADGFFDRREIVNGLGMSGGVLSSVSVYSREIAHNGRLFFNPVSLASLFFPATGNRSSGGSLTGDGRHAYYWSSSSNNSNQAWIMNINDYSYVYQTNAARSSGMTLRCVSCAPYTSVSLSSSVSSASIPGPITLTATFYNDVRYVWEFYDGAYWHTLATTLANSYVVPVWKMGTNANIYRVKLKGTCDEVESSPISVTGNPPPTVEPNPDMPMYVGAFWKVDQMGERVIHIDIPSNGLGAANEGTWTAVVSWLDGRWNTSASDGVVLSKASSPDPNIRKANPNPNAELSQFQLYPGSDSTYISGTVAAGGAIEFRIGLKSYYSASSPYPARYGVVLITYGQGKWRRIFIRQGQDPDYLLRPGSVDPGTGISSRPNAMKLSPYNLKHSTNVIPSGSNNHNFTTNSGVFTAYPSMLGYLFAYSLLVGVPAYNDLPPLSPWQVGQLDIPNSGWNVSMETCPNNVPLTYGGNVNYRRPNDGTSPGSVGVITLSEIRQSLWLNPPTGTASNTDNSVGGFYADGYFDRGLIINNATGMYHVYYNYGGSPVPSELQIWNASGGRLFFNPNTHASLFLPAAGGNLTDAQGIVQNVGAVGGYWTSSYIVTGGTRTGALLNFTNDANVSGTTVQMLSSGMGGFLRAIRCVTP